MMTVSLLTAFVALGAQGEPSNLPYPIVDTGQVITYSDHAAIPFPKKSEPYFGQDAQYVANEPSYRDNGDGTVSDLVTGLMWTQDPGVKKTYDDALAGAGRCRVANHQDWRLPTIKDLYSLIQLNGVDPGPSSQDTSKLRPFIDSAVFKFQYGDTSKGERIIDSQFASSTKYVSTTMHGSQTVFGVNFADGRIKGYPIQSPRGGKKKFYVLYVRGNPDYGVNNLRDNSDGTVSDLATGLTWMKTDSGEGMNWPTALAYAENLKFAEHDDWRLPSAKELQSIVDYTRSPDTTQSAAISVIFESTAIKNEAEKNDFAQYWSSSTHVGERRSDTAVYFAFGRSLGWMTDRRSRSGKKILMDVHGAGSQRSDPKVGDASRFPYGRGPQGDVIRIENMVRCVRSGVLESTPTKIEVETEPEANVETESDAEPLIKKPNIVFILVDDMAWPGTSVEVEQNLPESKSDFYQTPIIEKLSGQGICFSRAYSPGPLCTPSRAGILTGKTPAELHMTTPGGGGKVESSQSLAEPRVVRALPMSETTIAEVLKKQGYATAHFGKWHLGRGNPGLHGFDIHDGATANGGPGEYKDPNPKDVFGLTERGLEFMNEQATAGKPFYLQLSHYAVHEPVEALAASIVKFEKAESGSRRSNPEYAAMTWDFDTSVGMLLKRIDELQLVDQTYVVLMSDNGGPGNRRRSQNLPLAGGKGSLLEGGIRVPLFIRGPGIKPATYCQVPVTGCDLYPTFCEWAGVPNEQQMEGSSLIPLLWNQSGEFMRPHGGLLFHNPHYGRGPTQRPQSAIIAGNFKLLKNLENGRSSLFNLSLDISEKKDLSGTMPEKAAQLRKLLAKRLKDVGAQMPTKNPNYKRDRKDRR